MKILRVTFEVVNATLHPQFYCGCGEHPATDPTTIGDEYWHWVQNVGKPTAEGRMMIVDQYTNLLKQVAEGELIRNVRLWESEEPQWVDVTSQRDRREER